MKTVKLLYSLTLVFIFSELALTAQKGADTDTVSLRKIFNSAVQEWIMAYNSADAKNLVPASVMEQKCS
jgi:hypothetical protein